MCMSECMHSCMCACVLVYGTVWDCNDSIQLMLVHVAVDCYCERSDPLLTSSPLLSGVQL